jgi:hypothetical protein
MARPKQMKKNFHRIPGSTEESQRGRIRWTNRRTPMQTRISDARLRLRNSIEAGVIEPTLRAASNRSPKLPDPPSSATARASTGSSRSCITTNPTTAAMMPTTGFHQR